METNEPEIKEVDWLSPIFSKIKLVCDLLIIN